MQWLHAQFNLRIQVNYEDVLIFLQQPFLEV